MIQPDSLDLALIRWSVVCRAWEELSAGHTPHMGAFLSGWFWRVMGNELPQQIEGFRDSFRKGFAEADTHVSIYEQHQQRPQTPAPSAEEE